MSDWSSSPLSPLDEDSGNEKEEEEYQKYAEREGLSAPRTVTGKIKDYSSIESKSQDILAMQLFTQMKREETDREKKKKEQKLERERAFEEAVDELTEMYLPIMSRDGENDGSSHGEFITPRSKRRKINSDMELSHVHKSLALMKQDVQKQRNDVYFYRTVNIGTKNPYLDDMESSTNSMGWYEFIKCKDMRFWLFSGSVFANFKPEILPHMSDVCVKWLQDEIIREDRSWLREKYCQAWVQAAMNEFENIECDGDSTAKMSITRFIQPLLEDMLRGVGANPKIVDNEMVMEPIYPRIYSKLVYRDAFLEFPMEGAIGSVLGMLSKVVTEIFRRDNKNFVDNIYLYLVRILFISSADCNIHQKATELLSGPFALLVDSVPETNWKEEIFDKTVSIAFSLFDDGKLRNRVLDLVKFAVAESGNTTRIKHLRNRLASVFFLGKEIDTYGLSSEGGVELTKTLLLPEIRRDPFFQRQSCLKEAKNDPVFRKFQMNFLLAALNNLPQVIVSDSNESIEGTDEEILNNLLNVIEGIRMALLPALEDPRIFSLRKSVTAVKTILSSHLKLKRELF